VKKVDAPPAEYEDIYARFSELLAKQESAVDSAPFQLVADSFLVGSRRVVGPFVW
jgi:D-galactose 1-dehydrogenase